MTTAKARWREERDAEIVRLAKAGVSSAKIARIMHLSQGTVIRVRKNADVVAVRRAPLTEAQREQARQLMADGASRREAARSVGCTEDQLYRLFPDMAWDRDQTRIAANEMYLGKLTTHGRISGRKHTG